VRLFDNVPAHIAAVPSVIRVGTKSWAIKLSAAGRGRARS
jgi:hypothetical protein